jgi:hypothetical protein
VKVRDGAERAHIPSAKTLFLLGLLLGPISFGAATWFLTNALGTWSPDNSAATQRVLAEIGSNLATSSFIMATAMVAASFASIAVVVGILPGRTPHKGPTSKESKWALLTLTGPVFIASVSLATGVAAGVYDSPVSSGSATVGSSVALFAVDDLLLGLLLWQVLFVLVLVTQVLATVLSRPSEHTSST